MTVSRLLLVGALALATTGAHADATYHVLADGAFSQNWSNTGLITTNDDWSGVPSIEGYRGDNLTGSTGTDPRTILAFGSSALNVVANNSDPSGATSGGVYEVEGGAPIAGNPTIAFQGSGTADAPFVLLRLNTAGCSNINVSYNLRDIDTAELTPAQQVVLQVRSGESGDFANVDGTYVAIANTGGSIPGAATLAAPFGNQAQVQLRWLTTNAVDTDAMIGIDDIQVTGTCADIPPTVSSTTPANNASNVAPEANISIQFSEAVTTNPGWIAFSCTVSGNVAAVESGTGSSRTLDPVPTLAFGEVCTGTVVAANVIDQDGTPDAMTANFVFSFTVQADVPPTVASTVPATGVSGVAVGSNVTINFSEPVNVSGSWYAITCANSGAHPAVASGGPQNYTLNPDTDFDFLELCTVNLDAALIVDQDGSPDPMTSNYSWSFTSAGSPSDYYAGVDASNAAALRGTLHAIIDDHTRIAYTNGTPNTWAVLNLADQDPVDTSKILDVYKNASYTKITGGQGAYNREHTWPNSLGFGNNDPEFAGAPASAQNQPYTDTHMLYLSDTTYNSNRGNKYFGNCSASCAEDPTLLNHGQGGGSGVYPGNSNWYNSVLYEVWGKRKGDMARAMFYMDIRYEGGTHGVTGATEPDLRLTDNPTDIVNTGGNAAVGYMGLLSVLLQWHIEDPVTPAEVVRNEVIQSFQGNRNPFIDHPEWVACIWQDVCAAGDGIFDNGFE
jgi:endonuclease I/methionine-rich copper-binding protein CopC